MRILGIDPGLHITGYGVVDLHGNPLRPQLINRQRDSIELPKTPIADRLVELENRTGRPV